MVPTGGQSNVIAKMCMAQPVRSMSLDRYEFHCTLNSPKLSVHLLWCVFPKRGLSFCQERAQHRSSSLPGTLAASGGAIDGAAHDARHVATRQCRAIRCVSRTMRSKRRDGAKSSVESMSSSGQSVAGKRDSRFRAQNRSKHEHAY